MIVEWLLSLLCARIMEVARLAVATGLLLEVVCVGERRKLCNLEEMA